MRSRFDVNSLINLAAMIAMSTAFGVWQKSIAAGVFAFALPVVWSAIRQDGW